MRTLLLACLSVLVSCSSLTEPPPGWHCVFFYNDQNPSESSFLCNGIRNPKNRKEITVLEAKTSGMQCMPNETFEKYVNYIEKIKEVASQRCN